MTIYVKSYYSNTLNSRSAVSAGGAVHDALTPYTGWGDEATARLNAHQLFLSKLVEKLVSTGRLTEAELVDVLGPPYTLER